MKQVTDLIGERTDQGSYVTGPVRPSFRSFRAATATATSSPTRARGRLVFAGKSIGGGSLIGIIHNKNDSGYRE